MLKNDYDQRSWKDVKEKGMTYRTRKENHENQLSHKNTAPSSVFESDISEI
jgi:hypothetical protein